MTDFKSVCQLTRKAKIQSTFTRVLGAASSYAEICSLQREWEQFKNTPKHAYLKTKLHIGA